jgi:hypothetical protein
LISLEEAMMWANATIARELNHHMQAGGPATAAAP